MIENTGSTLVARKGLYPPRQVTKFEPTEEQLEQAQLSLQHKAKLFTTVEYVLFAGRLPTGELFSEQEMKQLKKDKKNYIKVYTNRFYKKFPAELSLSEKEFKIRMREARRRAELLVDDKPRKRIRTAPAEKKDDKNDDEDKLPEKIDIENNLEDIEEIEDQISDFVNGDSDEDMGDEGNDYGDDM